MARTDDQLTKYAADIVAGLKNVQFSPGEIAAVFAGGLAIIYTETTAHTEVTIEQYMGSVLQTVAECVRRRGQSRIIDG